MAFVQVIIKCKCGKVLATKQVNNAPSARSSGNTTCPNCKKRIRWDIVAGKVSVYEEGR